MNRLFHDRKLLSKGKVLNRKLKIEFVYQNHDKNCENYRFHSG